MFGIIAKTLTYHTIKLAPSWTIFPIKCYEVTRRAAKRMSEAGLRIRKWGLDTREISRSTDHTQLKKNLPEGTLIPTQKIQSIEFDFVVKKQIYNISNFT